jgi:TetR/AcrR family transcriptional repressor of nem operon
MISIILMARQAGTKKAETHERIVKAAAAAIRRHGYDGVSVADIMKEAGLTHGGFYAHFDSREAMLSEALERAGAQSIDNLGRAASSSRDPLEALVQSYLSDRHLASPESGCALAALGSETRRQGAPVRKAATRRLKELVALIEKQLPESNACHDEALGILSALVGAMTIARLSEDQSLGRSVRRAAGQLIRRGVPRH